MAFHLRHVKNKPIYYDFSSSSGELDLLWKIPTVDVLFTAVASNIELCHCVDLTIRPPVGANV